VLRSLAAADLPAIAEMLQANRPLFSARECAIAADMVREGLAAPDDDEDPYQFVVAERAGRVLGYACFGTVPLTEGTYDLYWIVVHPAAQGSGIGRALMAHCEAAIAAQGGRLVVVETSSRRDYDKTRRFYERTMRYDSAARFADFYRPGDDKIVYVKYLAPTRSGNHG
jgi:ribosomal protein S18 acetylase RimI-like enzyme